MQPKPALKGNPRATTILGVGEIFADKTGVVYNCLSEVMSSHDYWIQTIILASMCAQFQGASNRDRPDCAALII